MVSIIFNLLLVPVFLVLYLTIPSAHLLLTLPLLIAALVVAIIQQRHWKRVKLPRSVEPFQARIALLEKALKEEQELVVQLQAREEAVDTTDAKSVEVLHSLAETLQLFDRTLPVLDALNKKVISRTEKSNIALSDRIFSIAEISKQLSGEIQIALSDLIHGEAGLDKDIDDLQLEVDRFHRLIGGMENMSSRYLKDMSTLKAAVENIGKFTDNLTDLADQTSLLSINASIEAARAGKAGAGFRIIASEVQSLARRSKTIAEDINSHIVEAASAVEQSFGEQESIIGESIGQIKASQESLAGLSASLKPQLARISSTVEESRKLSGGVTDDLNGIIVSLQYHDIIRQILDHGILILGEIKTLCMNRRPEILDSRPLGDEDISKRVHDLTSKYFTVDDEWDVLGVSVRDTSAVEERKLTMQAHKLEGDITLF